jgi:hypothetical protein
MDHYFRDAYGQPLGFIRDEWDGSQEIYDAFGVPLGHYDKNLDVTYDRYGMIVGSGNLLTMLLK